MELISDFVSIRSTTRIKIETSQLPCFKQNFDAGKLKSTMSLFWHNNKKILIDFCFQTQFCFLLNPDPIFEVRKCLKIQLQRQQVQIFQKASTVMN